MGFAVSANAKPGTTITKVTVDPKPDPSGGDDGDGMDTWLIVFIILCIMLGLLALGFVIYCCLKKARAQAENDTAKKVAYYQGDKASGETQSLARD